MIVFIELFTIVYNNIFVHFKNLFKLLFFKSQKEKYFKKRRRKIEETQKRPRVIFLKN